MKKSNITLPPPVGVIYPEGGEPLYEEAGTGLRLTASDFAARHGYEKPSEVEKAYKKYSEEVQINGRRPTNAHNNQNSPAV